MRKNIVRLQRRTTIIISAVVLIVLVTAGLIMLRGLKPKVTDEMLNVPTSSQISVSHPAHRTEAEFRANAEVVVRGTVLDNGSAVSGDSLPRTGYKFKVLSVSKGNIPIGKTLSIVMLGDTVSEPKRLVEGMPLLQEGKEYLVFGNLSDDGSLLYPLAGGAAVGLKTGDNTYTLPSEATSSDPLEVKEESNAPTSNDL